MVMDDSASGCIVAYAPAEENRYMQMALKTRRWTRADLERMPDDGNTYEVVRGELFVSPGPALSHQRRGQILPFRRRPGRGRQHHDVGKHRAVLNDHRGQ